MHTITDFAKQFSISRQAVHGLIKRGRLRATRYGANYMITPKEVRKFSKLFLSDKESWKFEHRDPYRIIRLKRQQALHKKYKMR